MDFNLIIKELQASQVGDLYEYEPMTKHTSYRVGGNVRLFIEVKDAAGLKKCLQVIKQYDIPYYVVGKGSNILFGDKEFDGIILSFNQYFQDIEFDGQDVYAMCGVSMIKLSILAGERGLSGFEFASGIPGNIGGVVFMNAGAYKGEISEVFVSGHVMDEDGNEYDLSKEEMNFSYRHSILQDKRLFLLSAKFTLALGDAQQIKELMRKRKQRRLETQPLDKPNAGSVFKNPDNDFVWKYLDACGLRGHMIGQAMFSTKHPNFIVNEGNATAKDILDLIALAKKNVREEFDIDLYTEVRMMNL